MDSLPQTSSESEQKLLGRSRSQSTGTSQRQFPLSMRERYVLWAVAPLILLSPWHAGSMLWWSNLANFGMALLPVIAALIPLRAEESGSAPSFTIKQVLGNLLKFPIFWLGLLFLGYIAIQGFNYSWVFTWTENKRGFFMQQLPPDEYIHWLPSGMKSPFKMTSPWQALLMWAAPWLAVCAMWCTFRRAKSWRIILWMVATVGVLLTVLAIAAKTTAPDKIFWFWDRGNLNPFGPFTYRNQASVMLYMAMASAFALFFYYQRAQSRDSGIQWFAMLVAVVSLVGGVMSASRAGWIGMIIVFLAAVFLFGVRLLWQRDYSFKQLLLQAAIFLCILGGVGYFISKVDLNPMMKKWNGTLNVLNGEIELDSGILARKKVALLAFQMFNDNPVTGWGAGSFRFYFPVYQQTAEDDLKHPIGPRGKLNYKKRLFWKDAHSDWAQILAEYGIVGSSFLLLGLLYWWGSILLRLRSLHCEHWILLIATATMVFHSVLDIIFYNPALVIAFSMVISSAAGLKAIPPRQVQPRSSFAATLPSIHLKSGGSATSERV